ncbi:hypothetical protein FOA43_003386 [Brettanomyces nanus]|uniref:MADS-box domain-containing protein n=1 Tax=Eeniella nana TaxID=13502 RepID=A0A875RQ66_EENNA|nr:uncharacterized protein FOA43_003386 [Brettanomyces nanus]QPG76000.1 hypothetical protein FOA43_003386 [Brettanomyces nanus]
MGRRKIEIQPINDERNRTVTFVKRKAGLLKKAHELSILCKVDVAVIIVGNNRKIYQYSSDDTKNILDKYYHASTIYESKSPSDYGNYDRKSRVASEADINLRSNHRRTASSKINPLHNATHPLSKPPAVTTPFANHGYARTRSSMVANSTITSAMSLDDRSSDGDTSSVRKKRKLDTLSPASNSVYPPQNSSSPSFASTTPSPSHYQSSRVGPMPSFGRSNSSSSPSYNNHIPSQLVRSKPPANSKVSKRPTLSLQIPNSDRPIEVTGNMGRPSNAEQLANMTDASNIANVGASRGAGNNFLSNIGLTGNSGLGTATFRNQSFSLTPLGSSTRDHKFKFPATTPITNTFLPGLGVPLSAGGQQGQPGQPHPIELTASNPGNAADRSNLSTPVSATMPMFNFPQLSPTQLLPTPVFPQQPPLGQQQSQPQSQQQQSLSQLQEQTSSSTSAMRISPQHTPSQQQPLYQTLNSASSLYFAGFGSRMGQKSAQGNPNVVNRGNTNGPNGPNGSNGSNVPNGLSGPGGPSGPLGPSGSTKSKKHSTNNGATSTYSQYGQFSQPGDTPILPSGLPSKYVDLFPSPNVYYSQEWSLPMGSGNTPLPTTGPHLLPLIGSQKSTGNTNSTNTAAAQNANVIGKGSSTNTLTNSAVSAHTSKIGKTTTDSRKPRMKVEPGDGMVSKLSKAATESGS